MDLVQWYEPIRGAARRIDKFRYKKVRNDFDNYHNIVQLQWHSQLARRTYKSVLAKKCEGRELEPPLEQGFYRVK